MRLRRNRDDKKWIKNFFFFLKKFDIKAWFKFQMSFSRKLKRVCKKKIYWKLSRKLKKTFSKFQKPSKIFLKIQLIFIYFIYVKSDFTFMLLFSFSSLFHLLSSKKNFHFTLIKLRRIQKVVKNTVWLGCRGRMKRSYEF